MCRVSPQPYFLLVLSRQHLQPSDLATHVHDMTLIQGGKIFLPNYASAKQNNTYQRVQEHGLSSKGIPSTVEDHLFNNLLAAVRCNLLPAPPSHPSACLNRQLFAANPLGFVVSTVPGQSNPLYLATDMAEDELVAELKGKE